jgi:ActR/RegA family two-component response regulator
MKKKRVLVVDDDRLVADTLNLIFLANGFESEARYSAAEGLDRARTFDPELVLCDVTMPEESGLQLVEKLSHEMPQARMLMLTAYSSNAAKVEAHSSRLGRPIRLLNKPCRPEELLRTATEMLDCA